MAPNIAQGAVLVAFTVLLAALVVPSSGVGTYASIPAFLAQRKDMKTFVEAVSKAGAANVLLDFQGTLFLPRGSAWGRAGVPVANLSQEALISLLSYHVRPGTPILSSQIASGHSVLLMGNAQNVSFDRSPQAIRLTDARGHRARLEVADIHAGKSVIHILDAVLVPSFAPAPPRPPPIVTAFPPPKASSPPSPATNSTPGSSPSPQALPTVLEILKAESDLASFVNIIPILGMQRLLNASNMTIFAATDAALEEGLLLAKSMGFTIDLAAGKIDATILPLLVEVVSLHLVPHKAYRAADLTDGLVLVTEASSTLTVRTKPGQPIVLEVTAMPTSTATIVKKDILVANNVVIHKIDMVLSSLPFGRK